MARPMSHSEPTSDRAPRTARRRRQWWARVSGPRGGRSAARSGVDGEFRRHRGGHGGSAGAGARRRVPPTAGATVAGPRRARQVALGRDARRSAFAGARLVRRLERRCGRRHRRLRLGAGGTRRAPGRPAGGARRAQRRGRGERIDSCRGSPPPRRWPLPMRLDACIVRSRSPASPCAWPSPTRPTAARSVERCWFSAEVRERAA